jgi:hypothetical protein
MIAAGLRVTQMLRGKGASIACCQGRAAAAAVSFAEPWAYAADSASGRGRRMGRRLMRS